MSTVRQTSRFEFSTVRVTFESGGERCVGTLYRPDRPADAPVVVMGNGLAAERTFGLPRFAERFAERGYAVLLFDYRHFGDSEGSPRRLVSVKRQVDDYHAAMAALRDSHGVDAGRIVLWGASLSGGHAVRVAAESTRVAAVVAQMPMLDGRALVRSLPKSFVAAALVAGVRDRLQSLVTEPYEIPVVGDPGEKAAITEPGAKAAYLALVPADSAWENAMPARGLLGFPRYRPVSHASEVSAPTLLLAGSRDEIVPMGPVEQTAEEMADATLVKMPVQHFDVWDRAFEEAVGHQLAFLDAHLG
jgi:pimeloyl-ACP methyl ester carboxylesterase